MELVKDILGIGLDPGDMSMVHVSARGTLILVYSIFLVRIADKRFLSRKSALDAVLGFILASMMARAVNGSGALFPTLVGGLVLVLLHRALAHAAMRWHWMGRMLKGNCNLLIENGKLHPEALRENDFSQQDMLEDLRLKGVDSPEQVRLAYVERNGQISVVKKN